ncbi:MAG: 50S ribosomal protein L28 [Desulfomicrobium escambiense]|nr:50S ribosomal protein L28 [Desulfomicrobium escambiense]
MPKVCEICEKGPVFGHSVSHSHKSSPKKWKPNLQRVKAQTAERRPPDLGVHALPALWQSGQSRLSPGPPLRPAPPTRLLSNPRSASRCPRGAGCP